MERPSSLVMRAASDRGHRQQSVPWPQRTTLTQYVGLVSGLTAEDALLLARELLACEHTRLVQLIQQRQL